MPEKNDGDMAPAHAALGAEHQDRAGLGRAAGAEAVDRLIPPGPGVAEDLQLHAVDALAVGVGEAEGALVLAAHQPRQAALARLVGAEHHDRMRSE